MNDQGPLGYRLLTGVDNDAFCKRVSGELQKGYVLYGSPTCTYDPNGNRMLVAQAIVLPENKL